MAELKPPEIAVEMVELPAAPLAIEIALGDAERVKSGVGTLVMVRLTVAEWLHSSLVTCHCLSWPSES